MNKRSIFLLTINRARATDTDHMTEIMDLQFIVEKPQRREIFNFKDKSAQLVFKDLTSKTDEFSNCFENNKPLSEQINGWRQVLDSHCNTAFKKIRMNQKKQ